MTGHTPDPTFATPTKTSVPVYSLLPFASATATTATASTFFTPAATTSSSTASGPRMSARVGPLDLSLRSVPPLMDMHVVPPPLPSMVSLGSASLDTRQLGQALDAALDRHGFRDFGSDLRGIKKILQRMDDREARREVGRTEAKQLHETQRVANNVKALVADQIREVHRQLAIQKRG